MEVVCKKKAEQIEHSQTFESERERVCVRVCVLFERLRHSWKNNIKICLNVVGCENVN